MNFDIPDDLRFSKTLYLVEANSFERTCLWQRWHETEKLSWDEDSRGYWKQVGRFNSRPICVEFSWATIGGVLVAFWEPTSELVDHEMIEDWIKQAFPNVKGTSDAQNFHSIGNMIRRAS